MLPGYSVLRYDRADGRKQGGVLLAATPHFELRQVPTPDDINNINRYNFELVCANIYVQNRFLCACCVLHISPHTEGNEYMLMFTLLEKLCVKYKNNVLILGDFNLFSDNDYVRNYYEYFLAFYELRRGRRCTGRGVALAAAAADEALQMVDAKLRPPAVAVTGAAAVAVAIRDISYQVLPQEKLKQWNFNKADFDKLHGSVMNIDWTELYLLNDPNLVLNFFMIK
ncbi:unnamed protein product [Euphydryas editha]|uniref:Endonuclease/exonuclease/phosphatase domain-containing protein n=1 Tax=Euphydryas editha TaxID=104508 RepID=A0AAU9UIT6_EUPED|nr:unnamed protein product [Euphydryas editha]